MASNSGFNNNNNNNNSFASIQDANKGSRLNNNMEIANRTGSLKRVNIPSSSAASTPSSLKDLKKDYHLKKKFFTRNVQSAIESTQEVHSGWLKARTTFKRWTKVWCQVKPGYLILYTSQEALKKHRLGVVLLSVCQVIKRPTKKDGFCFKLINPLGCSVWAKSSTKALVFAQASLTLRVTDNSIGKLWLDALHRCNLSANLEGYRPVIDEENELYSNESGLACNRSDELSGTDDEEDHSTRHLLDQVSRSTSESTSVSSFHNRNNCQTASGKPFLNGNSTPISRDENSNRLRPTKSTGNNPGGGSSSSSNYNHNQLKPGGNVMMNDRTTSQLGGSYNRLNDAGSHNNSNNNYNYTNNNNSMNYNNYGENINYLGNVPAAAAASSRGDNGITISPNITKMVAKFSKYSWREMQLEQVAYVGDEMEELGSAGVQSEEVHDSNKNFLWHIIKQLRPGMDLSKVTLPTFILEPRSFLEKLADYYYHCDILSEACLIDDPSQRLINIVKWYLSGFYKKPKGPKKPYNPILGERFRCFWDHPKSQSRTFFIAEQVSHHPPISAFHVSNRKDGFTISCALLSRSKYGGNSVSAILDGKAKLHLSKLNETYTLTMPYANCRGILLGSLCLELGGKVEIKCAQTGYRCELDFKIAPMWANSNSYNSLTGKILKGEKVTHTLEGHWDTKIDIVDKRSDSKGVLWEVTESVRTSRLKRHTVSLKDQEERESVKLWAKVTEALEAADQVLATTEKTRLEDMQRQEARDRTATFEPMHFKFDTELNEWLYRWQDDRPWDGRRDIMQFEDHFKIRTLMLEQDLSSSKLYNPAIDLPLTQLSRFAKQIDEFIGDTNLQETDKTRTATTTTTNTNKNNLKRDGLGGGGELSKDTFRSIESRIAAGNQLFEEALKQVNERNRKLEEDVASLKRARGKRNLALLMTAIIVGILAIIFRYWT